VPATARRIAATAAAAFVHHVVMAEAQGLQIRQKMVGSDDFKDAEGRGSCNESA
jgi:hypothetical protein